MLTIDQAYNRLFAQWDTGGRGERRYRAALNRIQEAVNTQVPSYDLIIKMFNDLDTVVFHRDLGRRVLVKWAPIHQNSPWHPIGYTAEHGQACPSPRLTIFLANDYGWIGARWQNCIGVLLHEMLHAYFMIWCLQGRLEPTWEAGKDAGHGPYPMAAARRIEAQWLRGVYISWGPGFPQYGMPYLNGELDVCGPHM